MSIQKDNILLVNGGKKGAYYGVVHLLEKYLNCRVYAPNAAVMPPKTTVALPIGCEMDKPVNNIRIVNGLMTQQNEAYRNWQRLNDHNEEFAKGKNLETVKQPGTIQISTLYDPKSWILHPKSVTCSVSESGAHYRTVGTQTIEGEQRKENVTHSFIFDQNIGACRYIKFEVKGTLKLFNWHPSAGGGSWVFVDEIVVR